MSDALNQSPGNAEQTEKLISILRATPSLMRVLDIVRALHLPDWLVFSGAVYQPVLNHLTGRASNYGIKDYDLAYFDGSDLSYEAEDAIIRRVAAAFDEPLRYMVQVRNQARVHLWFERKFGEPYAPLSSSAGALERFASPLFAIGVRLEQHGSLHIEAPFGLSDLFALRLRPNPLRRITGFTRIATEVRGRWPELIVDTCAQPISIISLPNQAAPQMHKKRTPVTGLGGSNPVRSSRQSSDFDRRDPFI